MAREAVLADSTTGVDGVAVVMRIPFSITRTPLVPRLDSGSFFLALIRAYIPWLNLVVIPTKGEHFKKKNMDEPTLTLFFFNIQVSYDKSKWFRTKAIEGKSLWIHQIVKVLDRLCVLDCVLNTSLVPTFELGSSLNYTRQRAKELSDDK